MESLLHVVRKATGAHLVESLGVNYHHNVARNVKSVAAVENLAANALALPFVPIGNVIKVGLALQSLEISKLGELPFFAALGASKVYTLRFHFALLLTVGAFVEYRVKTVSAEGLVDDDLVLLLPTEIIEGKLAVEHLLYLFNAHFLYFVGGENVAKLRVHRNVAVFDVAVRGNVKINAVRLEHT